MKWLAVVLLAALGVVETTVRLMVVLVLILSFIGVIPLIVLADSDELPLLFEPICLRLAQQIAVGEQR